MTWDDAKHLLEDILCKADPSNAQEELPVARLQEWLAQLVATSKHVGERLAVCLCIDLVSGAISRSEVIGVIDSMASGNEPAGVAFSKVVEAKKLHCRCKHKHRALSRGEYVRIVNLRAYSSYYHEPSTSGATGDEIELRLLKERLDKAPVDGLRLEEIDRSWQGSLPIVWVTRWRIISQLREKFKDRTATHLNNVMGLDFHGDFADCTLYAIRYPSSFLPFCCQPTAFDAAWTGPQFYLSYRNSDGWGRTHPCSGLSNRIPERVHSALQANLQFFRCFPLGTAAPATPNSARLLEAAYKRLEEAMGRR